MSGIAGIIRFDGGPVAPGLVDGMTRTMAFRGPDGIAHWHGPSVALGHCMLRTTPESLEETQPLTNDDGSLVLVMDGRVDNWEELRVELLARGARLRTRADAELVLRAYETWGSDCLAHVDGDFALVIWDQRRREAFCARDRMGNKPFHYHWDGASLAFSSDLRPVLDLSWVPKTPNNGMLAEYLANEWRSRDETLWAGVSRLVPARHMTARAAGLTIARYWSPPLDRELGYKRDEEYVEHYRSLFTECVRRSSRSHLPVSYEVSGGLDSSAIFCMADLLRREGRLPAPGIVGYTLLFNEPGAANEIDYARAVGTHLGLPIHEVPPVRHPLSWFIEQARETADFPGYPNANMSTGIRERIKAAGSRVVVNGEGGDEWLGGSRTYYAEALARLDGRRLRQLLASDRQAYGLRQTLHWLAKDGVFALLPPSSQRSLQAIWRRLRYRRGWERADLFWLSPAMKRLAEERCQLVPAPTGIARRHIGRVPLLDIIDDAFNDTMNAFGDGDAARYGLDVRSPMQMRAFVEFGFAVPERLRLSGRTNKHLHVEALRGLLPAIISARQDKADFGVMFREPLRDMREVVTRTIPRARPDWVTPEGAERLYDKLETSPQSGWQHWVLWTLVMCHHLQNNSI